MKIVDIMESIQAREKVYCRYCVIDLYAGFVLISGEKWKNSADLYFNYKYGGTFCFGLRRRKICEYHREIVIKNRRCLLVFWTNSPQRELFSMVSSVGCCIGLKGGCYDNEGKPIVLKRFLNSIGYTRRSKK